MVFKGAQTWFPNLASVREIREDSSGAPDRMVAVLKGGLEKEIDPAYAIVKLVQNCVKGIKPPSCPKVVNKTLAYLSIL